MSYRLPNKDITNTLSNTQTHIAKLRKLLCQIKKKIITLTCFRDKSTFFLHSSWKACKQFDCQFFPRKKC